MRQERIYVLVCDGGRGEVLAGEGKTPRLMPVPGSMRVNTATVEAGERATGHASVGQRRYSVEEHTDPRQEIEVAFLVEMIAWLETHESAFDRLVVVAPPKALGAIRQQMPGGLRAKLGGEVNADLTKAEAGLIEGRVAKALEAWERGA